ncbi:MAG: hypothetical protein H7246_22540 [Phycisphaerae bacterium]|nr:hypothetical protein [Saprospiraceae bacterium]
MGNHARAHQQKQNIAALQKQELCVVETENFSETGSGEGRISGILPARIFLQIPLCSNVL